MQASTSHLAHKCALPIDMTCADTFYFGVFTLRFESLIPTARYKQCHDDNPWGKCIDNIDELKSDLCAVIGHDIVYVTSSDEQRHFDVASLAVAYGSQLLVVYLSSVATGFRKPFEVAIRKKGQNLGKRIGKLLGRTRTTGKTSSETVNDSDLSDVVQALRETLKGLTPEERKAAIEAAGNAVHKQLVLDNFPSSLAAEKVAGMSDIVAKHTSDQ